MVIRQMKALGYARAELGAMEIWEVASALGVGEPEPPREETGPVSPRPAMSRAVERLLHAEGLGPAPVPRAADPNLGAALGGMGR